MIVNQELENELVAMGASVVGFADVAGIISSDFMNLQVAVSIAVDRRLNENTVSILSRLQKKAAVFLRERGFRFFCIPPDMAAFTGFLNNPVYKAAAKSLKHVACPVSNGILKALEVELGMALPKDASIVFIKEE